MTLLQAIPIVLTMSIQANNPDTVVTFKNDVVIVGNFMTPNVKLGFMGYLYDFKTERIIYQDKYKFEADVISNGKNYRLILLTYDYNIVWIITNNRKEFPMWVLKYR